MARYHGHGGLFYLSASAAGDAASVGHLTDWALDMGADQADVTAFGDANKQYVQGPPDRKGSFAGFWTDDDDSLYVAANSSTGCKIYLYPTRSVLGKYHYGPAWLSISSISTPVNGAVKVAGTFAARGDWAKV